MEAYRYQSRLIAVVHSWQSNTPVDLSADIISCSTSKNCQKVGQFTIALSPRLNWFNAVFTNDVVNIYYDPGDGVSGWTHVMLGYVDRVARSEVVADENGRTATAFVITGSDFMKSVDRTEILYRPELATRTDWRLEDKFYFNNIGGLGMMYRGVQGVGPPDVIVGGMMAGMMGYGSQWQLPKSYWTALNVKSSRSRRTQEARNRISNDTMSALQRLDFADLVGTGPQDAAKMFTRLTALFQLSNNIAGGNSQRAKDLAVINANALSIQSYVNLFASEGVSNGGVYDIMDPSFVEGLCIDGYADAAAVWQSEGALSNLLYKWSNPHVNELIFDLRPVAEGQGDSLSGSSAFADSGYNTSCGYSRSADFLGINVSGLGAQGAPVAGVKYVPTMVMREHPYSTAPGLDLSKYLALGKTPVGPIAFGPIFSSQGTGSGPTERVFYNYADHNRPNGITKARGMYGADAQPIKHLDVARVRLSEMTRMDVSRGDADIHNMYIIYQTMYPTSTRYNLPDYLPIFNIASIARDGVRLREIQTNYAGWTNRDSGTVSDQEIPLLMVRWAAMIEHWYQHNAEYLSGQIVMRPRADIRVGYRLDVPERAESYYVTDVSHSWQKDGEGRVRGATTVHVTRGQRTDPMPVYVPPSMSKETASNAAAVASTSGNRSFTGRLAEFFPVRDATATTRGGAPSIKGSGPNTVDKTPRPGTGPYVPATPDASDYPKVS